MISNMNNLHVKLRSVVYQSPHNSSNRSFYLEMLLENRRKLS